MHSKYTESQSAADHRLCNSYQIEQSDSIPNLHELAPELAKIVLRPKLDPAQRDGLKTSYTYMLKLLAPDMKPEQIQAELAEIDPSAPAPASPLSQSSPAAPSPGAAPTWSGATPPPPPPPSGARPRRK